MLITIQKKLRFAAHNILFTDYKIKLNPITLMVVIIEKNARLFFFFLILLFILERQLQD